MGKKKEVVYYNGRYQGQLLDEATCKRLEVLRKLDEKGSFIKELQHIIYDLTPADVELIKETKNNEMIELNKGTLRNTQTIGVAYAYYAKRLILGDSVGMGKTVEVCGLCNLLEAEYVKQGMEFRFIYFTGKNLVSQAQDEMIKFTGNYVEKVFGVKDSVQNFIKNNPDAPKYSVVASHSLIKSLAFQEYIRKFDGADIPAFDLMIIDEAGDILTNSNTQMYKDASFIASMFDRIILLNATVFEKELRMFYNQINFIDKTFLPTKTAFSKEYEIMTYNIGPYPVFSGKYKNAEKFKELVGYRYLARTRKGTGATMTNCSADIKVVSLSKEQKYLLQKTSMPAMVYDCPSYFNMGIETTPETTPKLEALIELLEGELKDEKSILIYSRYKESQKSIQKVLEEYGYESYIMNGESSQNDRDYIINKFKLGDIRILITNVQKGLNFGNCNVCIFYTYDPNPNKMVQFEGRMTRSYNIENKHVYLIISRGKELRTFKETVSDRAKASDIFAGSDFSCVLSILLDKGIEKLQ